MSAAVSDSTAYKSLSQAARRIPPNRENRPVHVATLTRWITKGVRKADGTRIKLEARRYPGGWRVADEAVDRFIDELTGAALGDAESAETPTFETLSSRKRELARVDAELASAGF
jgi:hypothetical protein